jgi:cytochrome c5
MRKHIFLLASVGVLAFMALTTEKKILVTTGYAVTEEELALGRAIYQQSCRNCHEHGEHGAPSPGNEGHWDTYLTRGAGELQVRMQSCLPERPGESNNDRALPFSSQEIEAAISFMIRRSRQ